MTSGLRGLRICFLAGTLGQGGAERQLFYILSVLKDSGAQPVLLCLTEGEYWQDKIEALGIPVTQVGAGRSKFHKLLAVIRAVRTLRPQVLQSQHFYTNAYCGIAGRWLGIPVVVAVRNDGLSEIHGSNRWARIAGLRLATIVAANSRKGIENLVGEGFPKRRFFFLPNVIDTRHFSARPRIRSPQDTFTVLGIGRLVRQKRFDIFIEIVGRTAAELRTPIRAIIVGEGPERSSLEHAARRVKDLGVSVEFTGPIADPVELYQSADAFLLTSGWEGTPNVVMEAMACGLPVVASNVGGVCELLRHNETGLLFSSGDTDAAVALLKALCRSTKRFAEVGCNARNFIEQEQSLQRLPVALADLYGRVLSLPGSAGSRFRGLS